jgi:hypothetical protein
MKIDMTEALYDARLEAQRFLLAFMTSTTPGDNDIADSIKCIMTQFVGCVMREITEIAEDYISAKILTQIEIKQLRKCVIDLEACMVKFNNKDSVQ